MAVALNIDLAVVADLYAIGAPKADIAARVGARPIQIKGIIRRHPLRRDPTRYPEYLALIAGVDELWRPVAGASAYFVSNCGRVASATRGAVCIMRPEIDQDGYHRVAVTDDNGDRRHRPVHHLVADAFVGARPSPKHQVAHWDGVPANNRADNLRWASSKENHSDQYRHGTRRIGSRHPRASCVEQQAATVRQARAQGLSIADSAALAGVSFHVAADISSGKSWRHVQ